MISVKRCINVDVGICRTQPDSFAILKSCCCAFSCIVGFAAIVIRVDCLRRCGCTMDFLIVRSTVHVDALQFLETLNRSLYSRSNSYVMA